MKPGIKTSEFWMTLLSQVLVLLTLVGVVTPTDQERLDRSLANAITAIFTLLASASVVREYIRSRTAVKTLGVLLLLVVAVAPAHAQALPWRRVMEENIRQLHQQQRQQPQTDPAMLEALRQISETQRQIVQLLQRQQPAQPQPIVLGPLQAIPLGGPPAQQIPLGEAPKQQLPLGSPPRQDVPLGPPPKQEIPLGPAPKAQPTYQRYARH